MARTIVKLAIFLLFVHALYRFVPVYVHYQQFKDAVHETVLFSKGKTDVQIVDRVVELAEKYEIPLKRDDIQIRRDRDDVSVDASYVASIEWLPRYRRPWQFEVATQAFVGQ